MTTNLKEVTLFATDLRDTLLVFSTKERKEGSEAYMRNQFVFIGVDTTTRRQLFKSFLSSHKKPRYSDLSLLVKNMWQLEREVQYCAIELAALYRREWQQDFIDTIEMCIVTDSWWDTVDHIASEWTGPYFQLFPNQIKKVTGRWNHVGNIWLQRSSIMFQKKYKDQTNTAMLSEYILRCVASNEFFIQKAIGWALREFAKTNKEWVSTFVAANNLKPLSRKEALKNI